MDTNPQFNLRWNNHHFNIIQVFLEQLTNESLVDVTLSCQGQFIKVHKMVLSACSPYFQDLFSIHQVQHPVIILNGIKFHDLKMVVDFMYRGETRVMESELNDILAVAETLQIKGLCTVRNKSERHRTVETTGNADEHFPPELVAMDALEFTNPSESLKPPRKRKRPSEGKRQDSSKVSCQERLSTEPTQLELTVPKLNHNITTPKIVTPKVSPPAVASSKAISPRALSPRATSPISPSSGASSPKLPSPKGSYSNPHSSKKISVKGSEEYSSSAPNEVEQDALPFVQVSLSETSDEDDNDLATTITVNPLFIRDIDDGDASWDDPSRLVIDLPSDEAEEIPDKSQAKPVFAEKKEYLPVKATFVAKPKLKVRSAADLVRASLSAQSSSETSSVQETESTSDKSTSEPNFIDQRRGHRIPRPPNAFMIFANEWRKKLALENPTESNKQISVRLGIKWKSMTVENKAVYFTASRKADEEHKQKYPNYFYSPKEARLRKSQMQALRQKHVIKAIPIKKPNNKDRDPLEITTKTSTINCSPAFFPDVTNSGITVKEEPLDDESNPQNLEAEFLKMVEDGQVEAEIQEDDGGNPVSLNQIDNYGNPTKSS